MTVAHNLIQEVLDQLKTGGWTSHDIFAVEMAMEEALANAVHHGNQGDPLKKVHFSCQISEVLAKIQIEDEGEGFDPKSIMDPRAPENLERASGRGVFLIMNFMNRVEYSDCGRRVDMEKDSSKARQTDI